MPKKLMDCITKVRNSGKSRSEAWAICQESTGLKPHKKSEGGMGQTGMEEILILATKLDENGKLEFKGIEKVDASALGHVQKIHAIAQSSNYF